MTGSALFSIGESGQVRQRRTSAQGATLGFFAVAAASQAAAIAAVPAGGVGAAAGGWDTAANRDDAITKINSLLTAMRNYGLIAP